MTRKDLEDHFDKINYYPIGLVYDTIQAEIDELREGQKTINKLYGKLLNEKKIK